MSFGYGSNGHSTAAITLRNNCLQSQNSAELVATLLDAAGAVLETKRPVLAVLSPGNLPGEKNHLLPAWHPRSGASRSAR